MRLSRSARRRAPGRAARPLAALAAAAAGAAALAGCGREERACDPTDPGCRPPLERAPVVGDLMRLNARTDAPCDTTPAGFRVGRVAAVSNRAIVVADTLNPAGGLTDDDYLRVAQAFDTLVYPVSVRHFGEPTDLDGNRRSIIFYTSAVNALTPASANFVIGGFFWNRDLLPRTGRDRCAGSNDGELFYMLAPDPAGTVNGNRRTRGYVDSTTVAVIAHEFQHLINASRRMYVLRTNNFDEETWLNEGLSHAAEELVFYQAARLSPAGEPGQSPRARLTAAALQAAPGAVAALNRYNGQNLARLGTYLRTAADSSPYANNDGLATRGGAWAFLRYAADRTGQPDSVMFRRLVNSTRLGYDNLAAGTGAGAALAEWFRDWAVANYADGLSAGPVADARYRYASWQFRSVLPALTRNAGRYPLATRPLEEGRAEAVTLGGGAAAYFIFAVPPGARVQVRTRGGGGGPVPAAVRLTLVRASGAGAPAVTPSAPGAGGDLVVTNDGATFAGHALVAINGSPNAGARETITVTATGLAAPAAAALADLSRAPAARLPAAEAVPITDAGLNARLRALSARDVAVRLAGARAAYDARRRQGQ